MDQDQQHIRLLSIFHYVLAAITALFGCLSIVYIGFGVAILSGVLDLKQERDEARRVLRREGDREGQNDRNAEGNARGENGRPVGPEFGEEFPKSFAWIFIVVGAGMLVFMWTLAVLMLIAGRKLGAFRSRTFCMVVAAVECTLIPLGTILGVFTLVLLAKPSVRQLFGEAPWEFPPPPMSS